MDLEKKKELILAAIEEHGTKKEIFMELWEEQNEILLQRLADVEDKILQSINEEYERSV